MKKTSKFLAFLLSIMIVLSAVPVVGLAEGVVEDVTVKYPLVQTVHLSKDVTSTERMFFNTKNLGVAGDHVAEFSDSSTGNYGDLGVMMTFKIGDLDDMKSAMVKVNAAVHSTSKTGYLGTEINGNTALTLRMYSTADMRIQEGTSPEGDALVAYDATTRAIYKAFRDGMVATNNSGSTLKTRSNEILQYGNWNNSETYPVSINLDEITLAADSDLTLVMGMPGDTYYSAENTEKLPYVEVVYDGAAILAKLNAAETKNDTLAFLNNYGEAVSIDMIAFNALSAPLQDKALGQVAGEDFASFTAFATELNAAIEAAASITDTVTVKVPVIQTVHYLRDAKDGAEDNVSRVSFNLKNYGANDDKGIIIKGDRVHYFNDGALYYNHNVSEGPLMTFEIGETENLKTATLKIKAARQDASATGTVENARLSVRAYSTEDMPIYPGTAPSGESVSITESCATENPGTYYDFKLNKMTTITPIRSAEFLQYGNFKNKDAYWMSFDLLTDNRISLAANSDLTIMTTVSNWADYYCAERMEDLPYVELDYDAIPMVYAVNQAADSAAMLTALEKVAGFEVDTLSDNQKSAVAAALVDARPVAGYENYAALKAAYVKALAGEENDAVINRVKFDGSSISEVSYLADSVNSGAKLLFAAYSGNQLIKVSFVDAFSVNASESPARKVAINSMSELEDADKIKVFIWNGLDELVPLAECFAENSFAEGSNYYYSDGSTASVN